MFRVLLVVPAIISARKSASSLVQQHYDCGTSCEQRASGRSSVWVYFGLIRSVVASCFITVRGFLTGPMACLRHSLNYRLSILGFCCSVFYARAVLELTPALISLGLALDLLGLLRKLIDICTFFYFFNLSFVPDVSFLRCSVSCQCLFSLHSRVLFHVFLWVYLPFPNLQFDLIDWSAASSCIKILNHPPLLQLHAQENDAFSFRLSQHSFFEHQTLVAPKPFRMFTNTPWSRLCLASYPICRSPLRTLRPLADFVVVAPLHSWLQTLACLSYKLH